MGGRASVKYYVQFLKKYSLYQKKVKKNLKYERVKYDKDYCLTERYKNLPNQDFVVDFFKLYPDHEGLLLYHEVGSGKTLASIKWAISLLNRYNRVYYISSDNLITNFINEINKFYPHHQLLKKLKFVDIEKKSNYKYDNSLIIIDEFQLINKKILIDKDKNIIKLYNDMRYSNNSKILILTATPIYYSPFDISPIINLLSKKDIFPKTGKEFIDEYCENKPAYQAYNINKFINLIDGYISYYPGVIDNINIMAKFKGYTYKELEIPSALDDKILRLNSKKIDIKLDYIISNEINRSFIYTNYFKTIPVIIKYMKKRGISKNKYIILDGINTNSKLKYINNNKNIKYIFGTPKTKYGISIKDINNAYLLEPSIYITDAEQAVGRIYRICAHFQKSEKDRYVKSINLICGDLEMEEYIKSINYIFLRRSFEKLLKLASVDRTLWKVETSIYSHF